MVPHRYCGVYGAMAIESAQARALIRKAKNLGRNIPSQEERPKVLIVCEGQKTEPYYFDNARVTYRLGSAEVEICGKECGSAPISVVNYALERRAKDRRKYKYIFCVFDRDSHESFDAALRLVGEHASEGLIPIYSVPSFEYWLLLHFGYSRKPYVAQGKKSPGDVVVEEVSAKFLKEFKMDYQKGMKNAFALLEPRLPDAVAYAKRVICDVEKTGYDNPLTYVHHLINELRRMAIPALGPL